MSKFLIVSAVKSCYNGFNIKSKHGLILKTGKVGWFMKVKGSGGFIQRLAALGFMEFGIGLDLALVPLPLPVSLPPSLPRLKHPPIPLPPSPPTRSLQPLIP